MKGTFTIIVALGFIIILILCDTLFFQKNNITPLSSPAVKLDDGISQKIIKSETDSLMLDVRYPQTSNVAINSMIESFITKQVDDYKLQIAESPMIENLKNSMYARYITSFFPNNIVSFVFTISEMNSGAAHPNPVIFTKTYDLKSNKELTLVDVFKPDSDYINKISALAIPNIISNLPLEQVDNTWVTEGAGPIAENYQNFTVNEEGMTFYFSPYQVAPYATGTREVHLFWSELYDMLLPPFDSAL